MARLFEKRFTRMRIRLKLGAKGPSNRTMKKTLRLLKNLGTVRHVMRRIESLEVELQALRDEVDLFKSSFDVSPELIDEFIAWKASHPIPEHPLVTVTVATYNRAQLLTDRCIPSVLGQTYPNLELIIVGDGCTDETEEAVRRITDPRLKFYNLAERGNYPRDKRRRWMVAGAPAMNIAASLAKGDYLTHLDDDDEYVPQRLEKLVEFAVANSCDLVWHPFWWEQGDGT